MRRDRVTVVVVALALCATPAVARAGTNADDWPVYHRDAARSGFVDDGPAPKSMKRAWRTKQLDGDVYAEPLIADGRVIVATENNSVYSFDAKTGKRQWRRHLGEPVDGGTLECGNINPSGITSTPVIDVDNGVIYVVAVHPQVRHELVALSLTNGKVRGRRGVDAPGSDPSFEQNRGALALLDDRVLVPYGGLGGDCGEYKGYVVAATRDADGNLTDDDLAFYKVPTARAAGIWTPSGASIDPDGNVLVATGNATARGGDENGDDLANSVIRLSPEMQLIDSWSPRPNERDRLSLGDIDLGQIAPVVVPGGLVFEGGKQGQGYLLRNDDLGGPGGQVSDGVICDAGIWGGSAIVDTRIFLACGDGVAAIDIENDHFTVAWKSEQFHAGSPIVTGGVVWSVDMDGGRLFALSADDGTTLRSVRIGTLPTQFVTPSASNGVLYVAADRRLIAFK